MRQSHRISYVIANGPFDWELNVLHECDNPPCVNPDHLFLGTQQVNMQDCVNKGRHSYGHAVRTIENTTTKLSWEQVDAIKRQYEADEYNQYELAVMYGVTQTTIHNVVKGKHYSKLLRDKDEPKKGHHEIKP